MKEQCITKHNHRILSCENCNAKINIDEKLQLEDYDEVESGYVFFCNVCGESTRIIKL